MAILHSINSAALASAVTLTALTGAAQAETWYCTGEGAPGVVTPYMIDKDKLVNLRDRRAAKQAGSQNVPIVNKIYELNIQRNDENYLVASDNWVLPPDGILDVEVLVIEKKTSRFWNTVLYIDPADDKTNKTIFKGTCAIDTPSAGGR
jgi:hypothetical protein